MRPATVSATFVNHALRVAEQHGCQVEQLLREVELPQDWLRDPIQRIPLHYLCGLLERSACLTGLPHFGLVVGSKVHVSSYGVLGYMMMTSSTLGESLSLVHRYAAIVLDLPSSQTHISIDNDVVMVEDVLVDDREPCNGYLLEALIAGRAAFGRWLIGCNVPLLGVKMMHSAMGDPALYERYFGCPVEFGAGSNVLTFSESLLSMRIMGADPSTHKSLLLEADRQLGRTHTPRSVTGRLRALLAERIPNGDFSLEGLACQLAMSPRTLQRKLTAEGQGFNQVLESVRMDLAERHLRHTNSSVLEIALLLGFSQASAFSHAFRQARGMSPADFRKSLRAHPLPSR
ncbi:AraC family transcriptional regulator [Pseudomonas multiresinivorans]|uniref:AraC family transcriptional regulator n=2 Tax=Pseudomonas multiresinivorans TaxID=95301 RepID=A0A7Z3BS42_9PSED|nr:AraC family transcriptional regulator [Pseudomonas multiresinivorans]